MSAARATAATECEPVGALPRRAAKHSGDAHGAQQHHAERAPPALGQGSRDEPGHDHKKNDKSGSSVRVCGPFVRNLIDAIIAARAAGASWQKIGNLLGTSAQAAQQRYASVVESV
jgi:hypothetical protein